MEILIRPTTNSEYNDVIQLTLDTFLEFEAPIYGEAGIEQFNKDIINNTEFEQSCKTGKNKIWGAFDSNILVGLLAIRGKSHITLFFVHKNYQRQGIASKLFSVLVHEIKNDKNIKTITVNSSPCAIPFYHTVGFVDTDHEKQINGIIFTPMEYAVTRN